MLVRADYSSHLAFLNKHSALSKVESQREGRRLLFDYQIDDLKSQKLSLADGGKATEILEDNTAIASGSSNTDRARGGHFEKISQLLSRASEVFYLSAVEQEIYRSDSGTHSIPYVIRNSLANIGESFAVRPGTIADLQHFVRYAYAQKLRYVIRGAGTWPFGGAVPLNNEIVLDLTNLDSFELDTAAETATVQCGVLFPTLRDKCKACGLKLRQEITNPSSGTIGGWIATGGLGLGSYKYGQIGKSIPALFVVRPDGELDTILPENKDFDIYLESEGQLGIIVGAVLKLNTDTFTSKPYAFSFETMKDVELFVTQISSWDLKPTSILFFDSNYLTISAQIASERALHALQRTLAHSSVIVDVRNDGRIDGRRSAENTCEQLNKRQNDRDFALKLEVLAKNNEHIVVMEFDTATDYESALKFKPFSSVYTKSRLGKISYTRLGTEFAHYFWEHRFHPVEMKVNGPSMLVSETLVPLHHFAAYCQLVNVLVSESIQNALKTEAHFLSNGEVLVQSIVLGDTKTHRHKSYLSLVPLMTQCALSLGGRTYGTGLWNLPFLDQSSAQRSDEKVFTQKKRKKELDKDQLVNQARFLNTHGRSIGLKLFIGMSRSFLPAFVNRLKYRVREELELQLKQSGLRFDSRRHSHLASLANRVNHGLWRLSRQLLPVVVPPDLEAPRTPIEKTISVCAECDSCESVCPTSDVFGRWKLATPITRRKTAERLVAGKAISQEEALGFLACTRCDNCVRVCPTDIPLTTMFDEVEKHPQFEQALGLNAQDKERFLGRMWEVLKESPQYLKHTKSEVRGEGSHLQHGISISYPRGFPYSKLSIDPETCIRCGMCAHENACLYGARKGGPRSIPLLLDAQCSLCNACINYCPQNKAIQEERNYTKKLIDKAVDSEEKKYWQSRLHVLKDTTTVERSPVLTEIADIYVTEDILMEIDKEASTGQIPVSGMGQGDRHMGIGFDAERFSHFHIVGPAQNRLHEGDPDEELSCILGRRERYSRFDSEEKLIPPHFSKLNLRCPMMYNAVPLRSNGRLELAFIKVAQTQGTYVVVELRRMFEIYDFVIAEGEYSSLPKVVIPRFDRDVLDFLRVSPHVKKETLLDLWKMPMFEITWHPELRQTVEFITDSVKAVENREPLFCGYIEISEYDVVGGELSQAATDILEDYLGLGIDCIHICGLRNNDQYYVTSDAVRVIHHYLIKTGRRHLVSLVASGGIRLASDTQKTIQRGAACTLIDLAALLALDPYTYRAILENKASTERLLNLEVDWAVKRLNNQMESRKVQILEVLGAAGFKDIKKTVGEEGRLIDFYTLEERLQKEIFEANDKLPAYIQANHDLRDSESTNTELPDSNLNGRKLRGSNEEAVSIHQTTQEVLENIVPLTSPHSFYDLGDVNQGLYRRDHVWSGNLIKLMGRMAAGDLETRFINKLQPTGLLGDGFDVMKILYIRDPDKISDEEIDRVSVALPLDKGLVLQSPWMFGGKSVGSVGLDTWKAHVIAARRLGIQFDTGEGGYPTAFFLNSVGEPIFFTEEEVSLIRSHFQHDTHYLQREILAILAQHGFSPELYPHMHQVLATYASVEQFLYYEVIGKEDEPFVSTELKTGLFGVTKETIKKARRVVIAYSQGAKMGIGGHILAAKVNKLVSYLRGIQGVEKVKLAVFEELLQKGLELNDKLSIHPRTATLVALRERVEQLLSYSGEEKPSEELALAIRSLVELLYTLREKNLIDELTHEQLLRVCQGVIVHSYSSVISPFPFHNCYSIEDVKAFIDLVRMINPQAVVSVKVSPSIDIEFIAAGLARIARDNTLQLVEDLLGYKVDAVPDHLKEYVDRYGMKIELWLDGPRGGTGASPNIIKGQMGMHMEYAIPLIHDRLVSDGLRNYVTFMASGGIRTYEDVIKAVALGADGVIWGTAPLVAIGCDRNRNCHDGCSRGIATSNLIMQKLRDVDVNSRQIVNAFSIMQLQLRRALAALGMTDIRDLRGRYDVIQWLGLKERVDYRVRQRLEHRRAKHSALQLSQATSEVESTEVQLSGIQLAGIQPAATEVRPTGQTNCGVAAVIGSHPVPSHVLDEALKSMKNRGMDGVGVGKTMCFPQYPDHYAFRVLVKYVLQLDIERQLDERLNSVTHESFSSTVGADRAKERSALARRIAKHIRGLIAGSIKSAYLDPLFEIVENEHNHTGSKTANSVVEWDANFNVMRECYKEDSDGQERDYRDFGLASTDPGDIFCFFVKPRASVLEKFITESLLTAPRYIYIREYFPDVDITNFSQSPSFMSKAEDLFVFNTSRALSEILYVYEPNPQLVSNGVVSKGLISSELASRGSVSQGFLFTDVRQAIERLTDFAISKLAGTNGGHSEQEISGVLDDFVSNLSGVKADVEKYIRELFDFSKHFTEHQHPICYSKRSQKIAATMSCGKNFGVWKTAGQVIPWQTPAACNNIIHVRLATGSVVEQMNSHPFAKLHTALTHNGETTNYETLKQRVEQFGLAPHATTDTEVAALKFHLLADELHYPDWALFEAFSPTTGDDLALAPEHLRTQLEELQRVEFTSSPDGPYQYLCLRHDPAAGVTERIDLKDPADLRPNVTLIWNGRVEIDRVETGTDPLTAPESAPISERRIFSVIASEEQAAKIVLELLDENGIIAGREADHVFVTTGMISRFSFDKAGNFCEAKFLDRYGETIEVGSVEHQPTHYSVRNTAGTPPENSTELAAEVNVLLSMASASKRADWIFARCPNWSFETFRFVLDNLVSQADSLEKGNAVLATLTYVLDFMRTRDTGSKAKGSLRDIVVYTIDKCLFALADKYADSYRLFKFGYSLAGLTSPEGSQTLVVAVKGFTAEGTDPRFCLASFLAHAYGLGWRKFILFQVNGERLISTAVMGTGNTDDVEIDVYGTPGEYLGAFMQGGVIRVHGNAQNFCAMGMHHGTLVVYGNAGKVCGYASKGGSVTILGNVVDRAWTNSVNDPRCQPLVVRILGTASKYCGESLMGGDFFFGGLKFNECGELSFENRPFRGTKLLGGASVGRMLFFDPRDKLIPEQYASSAKVADIAEGDWEFWRNVVLETFTAAGITVRNGNNGNGAAGNCSVMVDGCDYELTPKSFKLLLPSGGLRGYESH